MGGVLGLGLGLGVGGRTLLGEFGSNFVVWFTLYPSFFLFFQLLTSLTHPSHPNDRNSPKLVLNKGLAQGQGAGPGPGQGLGFESRPTNPGGAVGGAGPGRGLPSLIQQQQQQQQQAGGQLSGRRMDQ